MGLIKALSLTNFQSNAKNFNPKFEFAGPFAALTLTTAAANRL